MANGGTTGDDLERLQVQVDATRTELGEVAGAVGGLTELVTDLIRRSSSTTDHSGDRWQARLASLETRFEMLETAIRVEVERFRGAAGNFDALADDFKTTVGGTHDLVELASVINERLSALESLEQGVRSAAQEVASSFEQRLNRQASDREQQDESLAARVGGVLTNAQTSMVDALAAVRSEISEALTQVRAQHPELTGRLDQLASDLDKLAGAQHDPGDLLTRIQEEFAAVREVLLLHLQAEQPQLTARLDQLAGDLTALAAAQPDPGELVARIHDRLAGDLTALAAAQPDPGELVARIHDQLAGDLDELASQLQTEEPLLATRIDKLIAEVEQLTRRPDFAEESLLSLERLDRIAAEVAELRAAEGWMGAQLAPLSERVDSVLAIVQTGFAPTPDVRPSIEQLTSAIAELRDVAAGRNEEWAENHDVQLATLSAAVYELKDGLRENQPDVTAELERVQAELADLLTHLPDALLAPITERFDRVALEFIQLRDTQPALVQISSAIDQLRHALPDSTDVQHELGERLNGITAELVALRADQFALDRVTAEIAALRVSQPDPEVALNFLAERLGSITTEVAALRADQSVLENITAEIAALRVAQPDPEIARSFIAERLEGITAELESVRAAQRDPELVSFLADRLDAISVELKGVRTEQSAPDQLTEQLNEQLDGIATQLAALQSGQADPEALIGSIASILSEHLSVLTELQTTQPRLADRLDAIAADLADAERPETILAPVSDRLDRLAIELIHLRETQPALAQISDAIADLRERQFDPAEAQEMLTERIDRVGAELVAMRSELSKPDDAQHLIGERLDLIANEVAALRTAQPDPAVAQEFFAAAINQIAEEVAALRTARPDHEDAENVIGDRLDAIEFQIASFRSALADPAAVIGQVASIVSEQSTVLSAVQAAQPQLAIRLDQLATDIAELADRADAPSESPLAIELLDRIVAEISALRVAQPDPNVAQTFFVEQLESIGTQIAALRTVQPDPQGLVGTVVSALDQHLAVLTDLQSAQPQLVSHIDLLRADLGDAVRPEVVLAPISDRLDRIAIELIHLRETQPALEEIGTALSQIGSAVDQLRETALTPDAPQIDTERLDAIEFQIASFRTALADPSAVIGQVASMVSEQSAALNAIHAAQPQLAVRLENVAANLSDVVERLDAPDQSPMAFELLDRIVAEISALRAALPDADVAQEFFSTRLDRIGEQLSTLRADQPDLNAMASTIHARLDELGIGLAGMENLADRFGRVDNERSTVVTQQIDEVLLAVKGLSDRQTTSLIDVLERFEEVRAGIANTQEATLSVEAALRAAAEDGSDERFGELAQQLASMSSDVKSTVRAVVGLGADFTGLRAEVQQLAESAPDETDAAAEVREALVRLDAAVSQRDGQLRDAMIRLDSTVAGREAEVTDSVARLDATLANRDTSIRDTLSRLDASISTASRESDFADLARQFEAAIADLRRDLQIVQQTAANTDVVEMVRSLLDRDANEGVQVLYSSLREVHSDIDSTRSEVQSMSGAINHLSSELGGAAGQAIVASVASAMSHHESRIDGEFDAVGRQMEALGTLLGQVIDSLHRVESQVVGVQPVSEKMRAAAASVLDSLRTNVRQRAAARHTPELGAGPRVN